MGIEEEQKQAAFLVAERELSGVERSLMVTALQLEEMRQRVIDAQAYFRRFRPAGTLTAAQRLAALQELRELTSKDETRRFVDDLIAETQFHLQNPPIDPRLIAEGQGDDGRPTD